jgi:hypothetical protein
VTDDVGRKLAEIFSADGVGYGRMVSGQLLDGGCSQLALHAF